MKNHRHSALSSVLRKYITTLADYCANNLQFVDIDYAKNCEQNLIRSADIRLYSFFYSMGNFPQ